MRVAIKMRQRNFSKPSKHRKNRPPVPEPWIWFTRAMLESEAWRALTLPARRALDRILLEHMSHGGTRNGDLPVTYDDFVRWGVSRKSVKDAIDTLVELGFVDVVVIGGRSYGCTKRPSRFSLTWMPRYDEPHATNRWKRIKARTQAKMLVKEIRKQSNVTHAMPREKPHDYRQNPKNDDAGDPAA